MKNLWFLSEEKPREKVLLVIIDKFCKDINFHYSVDKIIITPVLNKKKFTFIYQVGGIRCGEINNIFIKIVSGKSSFVDYLVFYQEKEPNKSSIPLYAIEETKTDDSESRNTGVYQRCTKFVYVDFYYPNVKKLMLYNLQIKQKETQTQTNVFGTKLLLTMGVEIIGKRMDIALAKPFSDIDDLIRANTSIKAPPKGNVPIKIIKFADKITISGRLYKADGLCHDPNIGALTTISYCLRILGWKKDIVITLHGLSQRHIGRTNKFIRISNKLDILLDGLSIPTSTLDSEYWHGETTGEKNVTIFLHLIINRFTDAKIIYENHAGCERGYLYNKEGKPFVVAKYQEGLKESYKNGNKNAIISIPDLIIYDKKKNSINVIEGKKFTTRNDGVAELEGFDYIIDHIIKPLFKPSSITRSVVVFGSKNNVIKESQIALMLNENGEIIVNEKAPEIIKVAVKNLLSSQ